MGAGSKAAGSTAAGHAMGMASTHTCPQSHAITVGVVLFIWGSIGGRKVGIKYRSSN